MIATQPRRRGWLAIALSLLLVGATDAAAAQTTPPSGAAPASQDPYTATVTVDATSDSVAKARDMARLDGARRALAMVVQNLAGGADKAKPLKVSDNDITDMVASFEVANEKMTAVRYTADYTYHFKPADVAKAMQTAGVAINNGNTSVASGGKPIVILPVLQDGTTALLWDDPNPWRDAWERRTPSTSGVALVVPLGDVSDLAAIDADKARMGDATALAAIAKKEGTDDVLVLVAVKRSGDKPGIDVTVRRYHLGQFVDVHFDSVDAKQGEADADLLKRAADTVATDIDTGWKNAKSDLNGPLATITVVAPITGLDDWIQLRDLLSAAPAVRKIDVKSLSRQEATLDIQYVGTPDQLKTNLASMKLDLQGGDPVWRLARSGADAPKTP
ncbi:MAG TPA: DUF2066 domain-containing protein [Stellaceae bacterium]|jgi:hypothetical protein|nr:DUF2066 domain-containing protein [Stellaceae bacterium]